MCRQQECSIPAAHSGSCDNEAVTIELHTVWATEMELHTVWATKMELHTVKAVTMALCSSGSGINSLQEHLPLSKDQLAVLRKDV